MALSVLSGCRWAEQRRINLACYYTYTCAALASIGRLDSLWTH